MTLPFSVSTDVGSILDAGAIAKDAHAAAQAALHRLLRGKERLELFSNVERSDDIETVRGVADALLANTTAIFVLGIGGSSLGGQALAQLAAGTAATRARIVFLDNPDPVTYDRALGAADLRTSRFVAISKSGSTAETLAQVLIAVDAIERVKGARPRDHFAILTEAKANPLRELASDIGCPILDHPIGIGGRYSVLTLVGILPALLMGLDAYGLREGARAVLADPQAALEGAALHAALLKQERLRETVLWPYADRLAVFGAWWRQLWAESLGKGGQGSTPVAALGPVDQHSQLQLFLDGPGHALVTFLDTASAGTGAVIPKDAAKRLGAGYLAGRTLGDLVDAELRATAETLIKRGRPVRRIRLAALDERALGALFMHFMLETILMGTLMNVDPFDQPAVEEGKVLAREYLSGKSP